MNSSYEGISKKYFFVSILLHLFLISLFVLFGLKGREAQSLVTVYLTPDLSPQKPLEEGSFKSRPGSIGKEGPGKGSGTSKEEASSEDKGENKPKGFETVLERSDPAIQDSNPSGFLSEAGEEKDYAHGIPIAYNRSGFGHGVGSQGEEKGGGGSGIGGGGSGRGGGEGSGSGSGSGLGDGAGSYLRANFSYIRDIVLKNLKYPYVARLRGYEGDVVVSFVIDEKGFPQEIKILSNSGHEILAQNTVETIKAIGRFPEPPIKVRVILPVAYRLK